MDAKQLKRNMKRKNKGAILTLMVMLVLLLSLSSLALMRVGRDARIRTVKNVTAVTARFAADAGIERTLYQMNKMLEAGTWTTDDVPTFNAEPLTACDADYTVTYSGNSASGYVLTSVGQCGNATETVRVTIELSSPFADDYAVLTQSDLSMKSKSTVSGYNSSDPSATDISIAIGTLSTKDNSIDIKNHTVVEGDVYIGVGGDPEDVVELKNDSSVEGEIFVMPMTYDLPVITPPDYVASKGGLSGNNITLGTSDSGKYSDISVSTKGQLEVSGDVTLYVTGDITLNNSAELTVSEGSSLTVYFDGDIEAKNDSSITNEAKIPSKIQLYGTGTNQEIDLRNSNDLYGVVYAPNAAMTVHNKVDIYGSFIVGEFEIKNSGDVYYDTALKDAEFDEQTMSFEITRWEEL